MSPYGDPEMADRQDMAWRGEGAISVTVDSPHFFMNSSPEILLEKSILSPSLVL